jgi:hypothetical protein
VPGEIAELINAQNFKLQVDSDTYIMLQELDFHVGRPEAREPTTDGGVQYFYGKGDHYFDATILATTTEIQTLNLLTELDANGDLTSNTYNIIATPRESSGDTATIVVNAAVVPDFNISKPVEGGVIFRIRFRITDDTVTVNLT